MCIRDLHLVTWLGAQTHTDIDIYIYIYIYLFIYFYLFVYLFIYLFIYFIYISLSLSLSLSLLPSLYPGYLCVCIYILGSLDSYGFRIFSHVFHPDVSRFPIPPSDSMARSSGEGSQMLSPFSFVVRLSRLRWVSPWKETILYKKKMELDPVTNSQSVA